MSLSSEAQALFDHARNSLPRWLTGSANAALEWLYGFTETFDEVRAQGQAWLDSTYILLASGSELDQHAADRGTSRRSGESDQALQARLRSIADAVTEPALVEGVDLILDSAGLLATMQMWKHTTSGWNSEWQATQTYSTGTAANFYFTLQMVNDGTNPPTIAVAQDLNVNYSEGTAVHLTVHYQAGVTTRLQVDNLLSTYWTKTFAGTSPSSTLTAGDAFTAQMVLSGVVGLRRDRAHMHANGFSRSFMSRGYRMTGVGRPMAYIVILPYLTDAATANAVKEYLRQNGPAGYLYYVERRLNP